MHAVARLVLPVVERRGAANGLAQVQQGVVAREELRVRDAFAGAEHGVALLAVPQTEPVRAPELVDQEEAPAVFQPGEHRHFVTEVLVNLKHAFEIRYIQNKTNLQFDFQNIIMRCTL